MTTRTAKKIRDRITSINPYIENLEVIVANPIGVRIQQAKECRKVAAALVVRLQEGYDKDYLDRSIDKAIEELEILRSTL